MLGSRGADAGGDVISSGEGQVAEPRRTEGGRVRATQVHAAVRGAPAGRNVLKTWEAFAQWSSILLT